MSRKMLITLIVLMAIVLSGLILVQASMIKSAADIREQQFNKQVINALAQVSRQLEADEENLARQYAREGRIPGSEENEFDDVFPRRGGSSLLSLEFSYSQKNFYGQLEESYKMQYQDTMGSVSEILSLEQLMIMRRENERRRDEWVRDVQWKNIDILYLDGRPIEERVDTLRLKQLLDIAISQAKIDLPYKYAVTSASLGRVAIQVGEKDYHIGKNTKEFSQPLFQNDYGGAKANYLNVYFPDQNNYLFRQTGLTIIPTIILTGLLIAIFAYALMVIMRQKKLSSIKNDFINNMTHE
ncbi:MAG TPA: hypothetical protein VEP89_09955, partial [Draconibacterium sp.]|nr:hypothetical protein [Draconibacterium sp.]